MKRLAFKIVIGFAGAGYLVALGMYLAPVTWHFPTGFVLAICPAFLMTTLSMTDPSLAAMVIVIAPLNAILYGVVGVPIGLEVEAFRNRGAG
jgi:hypothetical protein